MVYLILLLGIGVSSSAAILIRISESAPFVIAAYRMIFTTALLLPYTLLKHRDETIDIIRTRTLPLLLSGGLLALHFASWISSLSHTSVASSAFLVTTNPIFVGIGAWLILREPPGSRLVVGTLVALAGTFWISYGDLVNGEHALYGDLLAVGGAIAMSGHLLAGRKLRRNVTLTPYVTVVYAISAVILVGFVLGSGLSLSGHDDRELAIFLALAAGPQLLGHTSFNYALGRLSPSLLALIMLVEPIFSSSLAFAILRESPSPDTMVGGAIILSGIAVALARQRQPAPEIP